MPGEVRVFGVRHHGPGCARSLAGALDSFAPDAVLVEGPPDADETLPLAAHEAMVPPVALLVHPLDAPERAVFYPFAAFSPEWTAIRWALSRGVAVRFMDLPMSIRLAPRKPAEPPAEGPPPDDVRAGDDPGRSADEDADHDEGDPREGRIDPIGELARAAGFADGEAWWENEIERRSDATNIFDAILEGMSAVRAAAPPPGRWESRREAAMRQAIRAELKAGRARVAVVCGAWHAPVLAERGPASADQEILKGLPKTKTAASWIPWTHSRLAFRSGYGAGVESPGWYSHVWHAPDRAAVRWVTLAARLLRERDLVASSAGVIDAMRLADALAALRGLPRPGLAELSESIRATLCGGAAEPMELVRTKLEIGEALGAIPPEAPMAPLRRDLDGRRKSLRLKESAETAEVDLDLRREIDRERSRLFHRLRLISVPWAEPREVRGGAGTFHEWWTLQWNPALEVALVAASPWGSTIDAAASSRASSLARAAENLEALTGLLDRVILAELPDAVHEVLAAVEAQAAVQPDALGLLVALPPLARAARYGDVRGTPAGGLLTVFDRVLARALVGLVNACSSLDEEASSAMADAIADVQSALDLLERRTFDEPWHAVLASIAGNPSLNGHLRGRACRLLLDRRVFGTEDLTRHASLALATAAPPADAAAWLGGLLRGSVLVLLGEDGLWRALDAWMSSLTPEAFTATLPLTRRAFAAFEPAERRKIAEKVAALGGARPAAARGIGGVAADAASVDPERGALVLPVLARILGAPEGGFHG